MATIVNTPAAEHSDSGSGFMIGVILLIAFLALFFFYGLPYIGNSMRSSSGGGYDFNVPSKIDVNVNNPGK